MGDRFRSRSEESADVGAKETRGNHDDEKGEDDPIADLRVEEESLRGPEEWIRRQDEGGGHDAD